MNICITNVDTRPEYGGGIKRVSAMLANAWQKAGHSVCFMSLCRSDLRPDTIGGTPQFFLPDIQDENGDRNVVFFTQFIREQQTDVILHQHIEEPGMTALCAQVRKTAPVKVVTTYHFAPTHKLDIIDSIFFVPISSENIAKRYFRDTVMCIRWYLWRRGQVRKELSHYFSNCLKNCDQMVVLSHRFVPDMNILTDNLFRKKIVAINNPATYYTDQVMPNKHKTVLWCGRVGYDAKRVDRMLSIWKQITMRHPDWECFILGCGNIGHFKGLIEKYRIKNIRLLGYCDPEPYFRNGAILCMTSSTEGWGMVLVEAMAYGCVPVAYNSYASLQDIVTDGENGFAIPAFDKKMYIRKLELLMNDDSLRRRMAARGMSDVCRFNPDKIAAEWIKLFGDTI